LSEESKDIIRKFRPGRVIWPLLIGLGVAGFMLYNEFDPEAFGRVHWGAYAISAILLGFLMMVIRDAAYIFRMRLLTDNQLSWRSAFEVTLLWEFASAVTPSVVGGTPVAVYMLTKEKISLGKSTAVVFLTIFLDEFFYVLIVPPVVLLIGTEQMFATVGSFGEGASLFGQSLVVTFWIAYSVITAYVTLLALGIFIMPYKVHRVIKRLFLTRLLRRWKYAGFKMAEDLLASSENFQGKPVKYWAKAFISTVFAWMARYLVLNCILAAYTGSAMGLMEHVIAYGRQAVMFVMMIVSPTPGSSGLAEFLFRSFLGDLTPEGLGAAMAISWRLISYYPYLIIGSLLLPRWVGRVFSKGKGKEIAKEPVK
jgi:uncharacterized protein (TIRG00374 family)